MDGTPNVLAGLELLDNGQTKLPDSPKSITNVSIEPGVTGWDDADRMDMLTLDNANIHRVLELLDGSRNFREACDVILDKDNS